MKRLLILMLSLGLAFGASAQRGGHAIAHGGGYYHGGYHYYPRTYVGVGFGLGYPWGYGWYGPWGPWYAPFPPYYYGYGAMPPQLEGQIQGIKADYAQQIKDTRHDKALSHKERRAKIDQLKLDRDKAVVNARHDFYYHSRRNYNNGQNYGQPGNGNQNQNSQPPKGSNGSSSGDGPEYQQGSTGTGNN